MIQLIEPGFVYRYLLGALPDRVSGSRTGGRRRDNRDVEFVPGDVERIFSLGLVPIRERTALNVLGIRLIRLAHRVGTEEGKAPLHNCLVFFWSSCLAIVGCEFRKIRPGNDFRKAAARVVRPLAFRVWTIEIGLLAVLLKRDGNERPRSHQVFGRRLRGRLLTRQNKSEN